MNMKRIFCLSGFFLFVSFLSGPLWAQSMDREAFLDAEVRFLAGDYTLALDQYDEFIRTWPDSSYSADARYRRSVSLYRLGRRQEAYASLLAVESRYRSTKYLPYVPFWKGVIEFEGADYSSAAERFRNLTQRPPDTETYRQSLLYLGKAAVALGEDDEALEAFETLLQEYVEAGLPPEEDSSALVFLSDLYSRKNIPERQVALWERIDGEALDRQSYEQLALRAAEAYMDLDRRDTAMELFSTLSDSPRRDIAAAALQQLLEHEQRTGNEAGVSAVIIKAENLLRSDPESLAEFWQRVGSGAFHDAQYDVARSYFLRISAILGSSRLPQAVPIYLAEIEYREGDPEAAYQTLLESQGRIRGDSALLKLRLGWYALLNGDADSARKHLEDALLSSEQEKNKELELLAKSYLAHSLYRSGNAETAVSILTGLDAAGPEAAAYTDKRLLAAAYRKAGQAEASLEAYDASLARNPHNAELQVERMALLFENTQYQRVLGAARTLESSGQHKRLGSDYYYAFHYFSGLSAAFTGDYAAAVNYLEEALSLPGAPTASWAAYYQAWALYRSSRFEAAAAAFSDFLSTYSPHEQAYMAAYLAAWSFTRTAEYRKAAEKARQAADIAAASDHLTNQAESEAAAAYLEGTIRPYFEDYTGAIAALDRVIRIRSPRNARGRTSYTVKAAYEKGTVYYLAGRINEADAAYAEVSRNYVDDRLAADAEYRRGELMYSAERYGEAIERFAAYRQTYPNGTYVDAALYYGGLAQSALRRSDAAILLWERLLQDYPGSRYHFPTMLVLGRAYWGKEDWEAAFRTYTTALAQYGARARAAGLDDEAETLRYLMAKLPEKAARLHVLLNKENGAATEAGRDAALELARFYIEESAQREAGAALADEVAAFSGQDPAAAVEAFYLKGEYYTLLESWDAAAEAYMDAVSTAPDTALSDKTVTGIPIRSDLVPEALFKAARSYVRAGRIQTASDTVALLSRLHPASPWTAQGTRLMEGSR